MMRGRWLGQYPNSLAATDAVIAAALEITKDNQKGVTEDG